MGTARDAERKSYQSLDVASPCVVGIIDRCTECMEEAPLMKAQVRRSEQMLSMKTIDCGKDWSETQPMELG